MRVLSNLLQKINEIKLRDWLLIFILLSLVSTCSAIHSLVDKISVAPQKEGRT